MRLQDQDHEQRDKSQNGAGPVRVALCEGLSDRPQVTQRPRALDLEAEKLWQLTDQDRECDAVHVAIADRLGEELGDEAEP